MDLLGLLGATVALLGFPGGAFAGTGAALAGRTARLRGAGVAWPPAALLGGAMLVSAAALLPLPGSPAATLPPGGVPASLLGLLVLLVAGLGLVANGGPVPRRALAATLAGLPLLALCAAAASLSSGPVVGLPGARAMAARVLAGAVLFLCAPLLVDLEAVATPRPVRALALADVLLLAAAIAEPSGLGGLAGASAVAGALGVAALGGALAPGLRRLGWLPVIVAAGLSLAATLLALLGQ